MNQPGSTITPSPAGPSPDDKPSETQGPVAIEPHAPEVRATPGPVAAPDSAPVTSPGPNATMPAVAPESSGSSNTVSGGAKPAGGKKKFIVGGIVAAFVLLGGSASAYFGYIVPNKPSNRLAKAFSNLIGEHQLSMSGVVDYMPKGNGKNVSVSYKLDTNAEKNQFALAGAVGVSNSQFPYELRYVDKNIYAKVGGLDQLGGILGAGGAAGMYGSILTEINDTWYVIDSGFWQDIGAQATCVTDLRFILTDQDIEMIKSAYDKYPLVSILSSSEDTIDNEKVTKFELDPASDEVASSFVKELGELSAVKNIRECMGEAGLEDSADEELEAPGKELGEAAAGGTITVYITNDQQVRRIEMTSEDETVATKTEINFAYGEINVTAPEGAKPLQELLGGLFGGLLGQGLGDAQARGRDTDRKNELKNLQAKLETYFGDNDAYPLTLQALDLTSDEMTGPQGDAYEYVSDGNTYTLTAALEDTSDPDATNGKYVIVSINDL